ncbi:MAG: hypothetical protein HY651_08365 [Acidobacteria bacterium]|nr:hypothetical protein [Acidobacteriota bacterium]
MGSRVEDQIKRANEFGDRLEDLLIAKGQFPAGDRNTLLMAYWSVTFEFHRGVLCLLSHKFFGAAFALVRPIIEAVVRAHVVIMGSEEDLRKLREDEYRTNLATVGKEIDVSFRTENLFENFLNGARKALHSYTHAGTLPLGRRFSGTDLTPNYEEEEIIEAIRTTTSAVFMVNNLVTKHLGFEEEWRECNKLFQEWGKHS